MLKITENNKPISSIQEEIIKALLKVKNELPKIYEHHQKFLPNQQKQCAKIIPELIDRIIEKINNEAYTEPFEFCDLICGSLEWIQRQIIHPKSPLSPNTKIENLIQELKKLSQHQQTFNSSPISGSLKTSEISEVEKYNEKLRYDEQHELHALSDFENWLTSLSNKTRKVGLIATKIFISHAWPVGNIHHEEWSNDFCNKLAEHLEKCGFIADVDKRTSGSGNDMLNYMHDKIANARHVLVICNRSMQYKFEEDGLTGVVFEYLEIVKNWRKDRKNSYAIPICLNFQSFVPGLVAKNAEVSVYQNGYLSALKEILIKCMGIDENVLENSLNKFPEIQKISKRYAEKFQPLHPISNAFSKNPYPTIISTTSQKQSFLLEPSTKKSPIEKASLIVEEILRDYYSSNPSIKNIKLFGQREEALPLSKCFINLALIEPEEKKDKSEENDKKSEKPSYRDDRLTTQESIHKPKTLIELSQLFEPRENKKNAKPPQHLLIEGRAGSGKSTLSKYIPHVWAKPELAQTKLGDWAKQFKAVVLVPLRALKNEKYQKLYDPKLNKEHLYALEDLLTEANSPLRFEALQKKLGDAKLLNSDDTFETFKILQHVLKTLQESKSILYVLDGLDEIGGIIQEITQNSSQPKTLGGQILNELLNQPYWIMTSRPHRGGEQLVSLRDSDYRYLENLGLTEENLKPYIELHLKDPQAQIELLEQIDSNINLRGIAYVPINLSIICLAWEEQKSREILKESPFTLTKVYDTLRSLLIRRFIEDRIGKKSEAIIDLDCQLEEEISESDETSYYNMLYPKGKPASDILEVLAWQLLQNDVLTFTPSDKTYLNIIDQHLSREKRNLLAKQDVHLGLLSGTQDKNWIQQPQEFIHLTFQEYFAARYVVNQYKQSQLIAYKNKELYFKELVAELKYERRYEIFWWFVAGLLKDTPKLVEEFFQALQSPPLSLIPIYDYQLHIRCMEESEGYKTLPEHLTRKDELQYWFEWILENKIKYDNIKKQLWLENALRQSPKTGENIELWRIFLDKAKPNEYQDDSTNSFLSLSSYTFIPNDICANFIFRYFKHKNKQIQIHAIEALDKCKYLKEEILLEITNVLIDVVGENYSILQDLTLKILKTRKPLGNQTEEKIYSLLISGNVYKSRKALEILRNCFSIPDEILLEIIKLLKYDSHHSPTTWHYYGLLAYETLHSNMPFSHTISERIFQLLDCKDLEASLGAIRLIQYFPTIPENIYKILVKLTNSNDSLIVAMSTYTLHKQKCFIPNLEEILIKLLNNSNINICNTALYILYTHEELFNSKIVYIIFSLVERLLLKKSYQLQSILGRIKLEMPLKIIAIIVEWFLDDELAHVDDGSIDMIHEVLIHQMNVFENNIQYIIDILVDKYCSDNVIKLIQLMDYFRKCLPNFPTQIVSELILRINQFSNQNSKIGAVLSELGNITLADNVLLQLIDMLNNSDIDISNAARTLIKFNSPLNPSLLSKITIFLETDNIDLISIVLEIMAEQNHLDIYAITQISKFIDTQNEYLLEGILCVLIKCHYTYFDSLKKINSFLFHTDPIVCLASLSILLEQSSLNTDATPIIEKILDNKNVLEDDDVLISVLELINNQKIISSTIQKQVIKFLISEDEDIRAKVYKIIESQYPLSIDTISEACQLSDLLEDVPHDLLLFLCRYEDQIITNWNKIPKINQTCFLAYFEEMYSISDERFIIINRKSICIKKHDDLLTHSFYLTDLNVLKWLNDFVDYILKSDLSLSNFYLKNKLIPMLNTINQENILSQKSINSNKNIQNNFFSSSSYPNLFFIKNEYRSTLSDLVIFYKQQNIDVKLQQINKKQIMLSFLNTENGNNLNSEIKLSEFSSALSNQLRDVIEIKISANSIILSFNDTEGVVDETIKILSDSGIEMSRSESLISKNNFHK